jgi:hypothetical protein
MPYADSMIELLIVLAVLGAALLLCVGIIFVVFKIIMLLSGAVFAFLDMF